MVRIAVIGGGPAGFMAAVSAAAPGGIPAAAPIRQEPMGGIPTAAPGGIPAAAPGGIPAAAEQSEVTVLDAGVPLATLLRTGGGRCNLANDSFEGRELAAQYPRGGKFLLSAFARFGPKEAMDWFQSRGCALVVEDEGRIFPRSGKAQEVRALLEEEARQLGGFDFLVQGTLYPDVIESQGTRGPGAVIKSHHNVGGLPDRMQISLVEPLRELFKDEVREVGRLLGMPAGILGRHPFPGPGLAVRILGEVTPENLRLVRESDRIFIEELRRGGEYDRVWQAFTVLLPVRSVGVMGDERTYDQAIVVRAVTSRDGMTADWARLPAEVLERTAGRIVNEVRGVNRVAYDITSKPPGTIEWE